MTDVQIFRKVVKKAAENGYKVPFRTITPLEILFSYDFANAFWGEGSYRYFVRDHPWRNGKHYTIVAGKGVKTEVSKEEYDKNIKQAKQDRLNAFSDNLKR